MTDAKSPIRLKDATLHPKDGGGALYWPRSGFSYVVGDRGRGTVLWITPDGVLEMTPEAARMMCDEMCRHADDVAAP